MLEYFARLSVKETVNEADNSRGVKNLDVTNDNMNRPVPAPTDNSILNLLPKPELRRITSQLEPVRLELGQVIYEVGQERHQVYFPVEGIISVIEMLEDGASSEIALIGKEGVLGVMAALGGKSEMNRAVVQNSGSAYVLPAKALAREFHNSSHLAGLILLYIQVRYTQVAQTAVCNRHHNLQQQLCRWLLMSLDRIHSNEISMTQELIAGMLGVRREGITRAAGELQKQGAIEYRRGSITVVDRPRLEALCCECYEACKRETDRLLSIQRSIG